MDTLKPFYGNIKKTFITKFRKIESILVQIILIFKGL
jgi:hypothetical protein